MDAVISSMALVGNASGDGFPADREITSGSAAYLKISRIAEGFKDCTRFENLYSIFSTNLS